MKRQAEIRAARQCIRLLTRGAPLPTDLFAAMAPAVGDSAHHFKARHTTGYVCRTEADRKQAILAIELLIAQWERGRP